MSIVELLLLHLLLLLHVTRLVHHRIRVVVLEYVMGTGTSSILIQIVSCYRGYGKYTRIRSLVLVELSCSPLTAYVFVYLQQ